MTVDTGTLQPPARSTAQQAAGISTMPWQGSKQHAAASSSSIAPSSSSTTPSTPSGSRPAQHSALSTAGRGNNAPVG